MICKDEMMSVLLDASPSFSPTWQAFLDDWRHEAQDLPLCLVLADYARHLIALLERGDSGSLRTVFAAFERLHVEGEHSVREAATVGLLEGLQNENLHTVTKPEDFREYLLPETARWWDKLNRFWNEGKPMLDDPH